MGNKKNITFVAGLHGNEQMPVKALTKNKIPFILGNPRAQKKNVRFISCDLNASFGVRGTGYEVKRAAEILKKIDKNSLVVDFHTTASLAPFVIICDRKMIPLAARVGLGHVVIMKYSVKKGHALINYRDGISIETGSHTSKKSYNLTLKIVKNILSGKKYPIKIYEVYDKITEPARYHNFKKHAAGFVPVLAGEKEYTRAYHIYGLKARRVWAGRIS